jgi:hypothetical protein
MPTFPQKVILTKYQREILMHRLEHLWGLHDDDLAELFDNEDRATPLNTEALNKAVEDFYQLFRTHTGQLLSVNIESEEEGEILAECLEGSTFFATYVKGDGVYRHAAKSAAELLTTVLDRDVEAHIDPIPRHPLPPSPTHG